MTRMCDLPTLVRRVDDYETAINSENKRLATTEKSPREPHGVDYSAMPPSTISTCPVM